MKLVLSGKSAAGPSAEPTVDARRPKTLPAPGGEFVSVMRSRRRPGSEGRNERIDSTTQSLLPLGPAPKRCSILSTQKLPKKQSSSYPKSYLSKLNGFGMGVAPPIPNP